MKTKLGAAIAFSFFAAISSASAQLPSNLDFREGTAGEVPPGWFVPPVLKDAGYTAEIRREGCRSALGCAVITIPPTAPPNTFANLMQNFNAAAYRGATVRIRAWVRVESAAPGNDAELWFRVDRPGRLPGFFDNMADRPVTSEVWKLCEITGPVAPDAPGLNLGFMSHGRGRAWIDGISIDIVDRIAPRTGPGYPGVSPRGPVSLSFRDGQLGRIPDGWFMSAADIKAGNNAELRRDECRGPAACAVVITPPDALPSNRAEMRQSFLAERYRGKTVRLRAFLKVEAHHANDTAQLELQITRNDGHILYADNMDDRPVRAADWQPSEIVARIPMDAYNIGLGVISTGKGNAWVDELTYEIVPDTTPETGINRTYQGPANIDFHAGEVGRRPAGWSSFQVPTNAGYLIELRRTGCSTHEGCVAIQAPEAVTKGNAGISQEFYADAFRGKTMRVRARLRVTGDDPKGSALFGLTVRRLNGEPGLTRTIENIAGGEWTDYEMTGKIDADAQLVSFGLTFQGNGNLWIDAVSFNEVN